MTNQFFLIFALSVALSSSLLALVRTPEEQQEHLNQIIKLLSEAETLAKEERIKRLGRALRQLSQPSIFYHHKEKMRSLYSETQGILLNTPGHANYYRDRILDAKNKAFIKGQAAKEPEYGDYLNERIYAFQTLSHLPSLETMEVLSGFLDDTDRPSGNPSDIGYFNSLALTCTTTLQNLIQEGPTKSYDSGWRKWRDEVRAGHLTFRFKGSDIRYNFDGPVSDKQPRPTKPLPSRGGSDTPSSRASGSSSTDSGESSSGSRNTIIACATLLLFLALAWWGYTKRKS